MKEKIQKILNLKYLPLILLAVITLLQMLNITYIIVERKKGFHSDEMFSYGLSNGFYQPFIDADSISADSVHNVNEWISGDVLRHYITVQPEERFRYDSVWYNQENDRHPPLYYAVLHTICSFFPDTFSVWFGYSINLICFVIIQIFVYKLSRNLLKSEYLAVIVCTLWGFSAGAINITIFIRMYCMLAMWTIIFIYQHSQLYKTKEQPLLKQLIPLIIVTACGALTQHLFLFVAFVTAVVFCIRYLLTKRFKVFWAYGFSVLGGTLLSILIFPATINHLFFETDGSSFNLHALTQFPLGLKYVLNDIFPIDKVEIIFWTKILLTLFIVSVIMSVPVLFLLRDKPKVSAFLKNLKKGFGIKGKITEFIKNFSFKKFFSYIWNGIRHSNPITFIIVLSTAVVVLLTSLQVSFYIMGYVNRYLFIIYPVSAVAVGSVLYFLLSKFKYKKAIFSVIMIGMTVSKMASPGVNFLFDDERTVDSVKELTAGSECIITVDSSLELWLIDTFTNEIYDADKVFITDVVNQEKFRDKMEELKTDKPIYLFFERILTIEEDGKKYYLLSDENIEGSDEDKELHIPVEEFEEKYYGFYKNLSFSKQFDYIGIYTIFGRTYEIYRLA